MFGGWVTVTVDIDRATEFTGDDADRYSDLVDLGAEFKKLVVMFPALTSATVTVYGQKDDAVDTVPYAVHGWDTDNDGTAAHSTTAGEGAIIVTFDIGALQFIRLYCSANQAADRTFYVKGVN